MRGRELHGDPISKFRDDFKDLSGKNLARMPISSLVVPIKATMPVLRYQIRVTP